MQTSVTFERRTGNADNGKIVMAFTYTVSLYSSVNIQLRVIGPAGVIVDSITSNTDEVTGFVSPQVFTKKINIPTAGIGDIAGDYTFTFKVINSADTDMFFEYEGTYSYMPVNKGAVTFKSNCAGPSIQLFDSTNYTGYVRTSRTIRLVHPEISGSQLSDTQTTGGQIVIVPTHSNVIYMGYVTSEVQESTDVTNNTYQINFFTNITWSGNRNLNFLCATSIKDLAGCYEDKLSQLTSRACRVGGWRQLNRQEHELMLDLQTTWTLYKLAKDCGNYDKMATYYTQLKTLLNCDCCGSSTPSLLEPLELNAPTYIGDAQWADVPEDMLWPNWEISVLYGTPQLQWKLVNGVLYIRGGVSNAILAAGKHALPQRFLYTTWLSALGIEPSTNWVSPVQQGIGAGSDNYTVGWAIVEGNTLAFQFNTLYDQWPLTLSLVIPLE